MNRFVTGSCVYANATLQVDLVVKYYWKKIQREVSVRNKCMNCGKDYAKWQKCRDILGVMK